MEVINESITLSTGGNGELIDITGHLKGILDDSGLKKGIMTVFVVGSTAAITTFEYESGLIRDMTELYERLAPLGKHYAHNQTWGDGNGFSHVRAALQGPSLTIPFDDGMLLLGTWQQVVLADFDNRRRSRKVAVNLIGQQ
ncbi:MAG: YjbQ family protein [Nitrospirae bacterium]|nr:YjbQ family protein [Nitrospirota bacterium]MBF0590575.1 YjbQ family protein [Nitrospirota bacterium]